jgi:hypothetical protein
LQKTLHGGDDDGLILVLDGTYIYIYSKKQTISPFKEDRSLHKSRPLVKPMVVVITTGQSVVILGPYIARNNDASILNHMLKCNINDIKGFVKDNDIFVVDR